MVRKNRSNFLRQATRLRSGTLYHFAQRLRAPGKAVISIGEPAPIVSSANSSSCGASNRRATLSIGRFFGIKNASFSIHRRETRKCSGHMHCKVSGLENRGSIESNSCRNVVPVRQWPMIKISGGNSWSAMRLPKRRLCQIALSEWITENALTNTTRYSRLNENRQPCVHSSRSHAQLVMPYHCRTCHHRYAFGNARCFLATVRPT